MSAEDDWRVESSIRFEQIRLSGLWAFACTLQLLGRNSQRVGHLPTGGRASGTFGDRRFPEGLFKLDEMGACLF